MLSNLVCIPVKELRLDDGCFSRAHIMWTILNQQGVFSKKIWAITHKSTHSIFDKGKKYKMEQPTLWVWQFGTSIKVKEHIAQLYETKKGLLVLDPKVDKVPMTVKKWKQSIEFYPRYHTLKKDIENHRIIASTKANAPLKRGLRILKPRRAVHWSVHIALVVRVGKDYLVLDPSLSPRPLTIQEWKKVLHFQPKLHRIQYSSGSIYNILAKKTSKPSQNLKTAKNDLYLEWGLSGLNQKRLAKICK